MKPVDVMSLKTTELGGLEGSVNREEKINKSPNVSNAMHTLQKQKCVFSI